MDLTILDSFLRTILSYLKRPFDIRGYVVASLILRCLLEFLAPFRKKIGKVIVIMLIWNAYLWSRYAANQGIATIPKYVSHNNSTSTSTAATASGGTLPDADILALWSSVLLVILGGADTITALAKEDNELWLRQFMLLLSQLFASGRVLFQSLASNSLWAPTILMFVAGIIKNAERVASLYNARLSKFKSTIMLTETDPDDLQEPAVVDPSTAGLPPQSEFRGQEPGVDHNNNKFESEEEEEVVLNDVAVLRDAHSFFAKYKVLYVDLMISSVDRLKTRAYFLKRSPEQAFEVIEIQLNLAHQLFYTKAILLHLSFWQWVRHSCVALEVISLVIWFLIKSKKNRYIHTYDINLTYTLLLGVLGVDVSAYVRLWLSGWLINLAQQAHRVFLFLLSATTISTTTQGSGRLKYPGSCCTRPRQPRILFKRWSESIKQLNFLKWYCFPSPRYDNVARPARLGFPFFFFPEKSFGDDLRDFIFSELKLKSELAGDLKEAEAVCAARGDWVLRTMGNTEFDPFLLYPWTLDVDFNESLLLWHIATELCYQEDKVSLFSNGAGTLLEDTPRENKYRNFSKILSDYMMFLQMYRSDLTSADGGTNSERIRDTISEGWKFFTWLPRKSSNGRRMNKEKLYQEGCKNILLVKPHVNPAEIKGNKSKSVLFDACCLARELIAIKEKKSSMVDQWEVIAKVWVEMLSYAAIHSSGNDHAACLKQGGELITLVWLLTAHLGLGTKFYIDEEDVYT